MNIPQLGAWGQIALNTLEISAMMAYAISGVMAAARAKMDIAGTCVVALIASFGGGTVRDILIDSRPFFWAEHQFLVLAIVALSLLTAAFLKQRHFDAAKQTVQWPESIGLALFSANGIHEAFTQGMPPVVALLIGAVTCVTGSVLRDIVCNEVPALFKNHQPFILCALAGGLSYLALQWLGAPDWACIAVCASVALALRSLAIFRKWVVPSWH